MLKQKLHQQSSSSSSNAHSGDQQDSSQYEVSELANSQCVEETSLLLKLTDECTAAIQCAIKAKCPIRMHVQDKVATIEVQDRDGNSLNFKCSLQNQQPTDVIFYNPKEKIYKNVGSTTTVKMQVQATDKTFSELKEKQQKLVEEGQKKKAKEMPKHQRTVKPAGGHFTGRNQIRKSAPASTSSFLSKISASTAIKRTHSPSPASFAPAAKQQRKEPEASAAKEHKPTDLIPKQASAKAATLAVYTKAVESQAAKRDLNYIPKRKPLHQRAPSISPASTTTSTPKTISPPLAMARPASVESTQLQHSSSCSPEDVTSDEQQTGSMMVPTKPSCDWTQTFGKIVDNAQAKRYHEIFKAEYPEYRQYYEALERVADQFRELQSALNKAVGVTEQLKIEGEIRSKFMAYQSDQEFLRKRQRHHDLRVKLEVIKKALAEWNTSRF